MTTAGHWQGKFWGKTKELFTKNGVSAHPLEITKGGFSSEHLHHHRSNLFYVSDGRLLVKVWKDPSGKPDEIVLEPGDSTLVEPGVYHQFQALTDVKAIEFYWTDLDDRDIDRRTHGGSPKR